VILLAYIVLESFVDILWISDTKTSFYLGHSKFSNEQNLKS